MDLRKPIFDGQFYSADFQELDEQIKNSFFDKNGPGDLPITKRSKKIFGIVSPHAGYSFSGPCMAWAYKEIAESEFPETYIILGTSHSGFNGTLLKNYQTPFGTLKTDKYLGQQLIKELPFFQENELAHRTEHSIEVQLPFLQFVSRENLKNLQILPIIINYKLDQIQELVEVLSKTDRKISIIVSSDFTHFGPNYGFTPFKFNIKDSLYNLDKQAISFIEKLDDKGFLEFIQNKKATICGWKSIVTAIKLVKILGCKKARLLQYYTSGDIVNDYENAVGYGSLVFE